MQQDNSKQLHLVDWNDEVDSKKKLTAVIISIRSGESLDNKYHENKFTSADSNEKVLIASATDYEILKITHLLRGDHVVEPSFRILRKSLTKVPPSRVVINWENSEGFKSGTFLSGKEPTFELISKAIERGYTQIFSGYSLMTLLENWTPRVLGENVFSEIQGTENQAITIRFDQKALENESSDRLNAMAEILSHEEVTFLPKKFSCKYAHKLGSTLGDQFEFRVVSVNKTVPSPNEKQNHTLHGVVGSYGHTVLEYKSHGRLILSAANFSELHDVKIDNVRLFESMDKRKGIEYRNAAEQRIEAAENKEETTRQVVVDYLKSLLPC